MTDRMQTLVRLSETVPFDVLPDVVAAFDTPRHRFSIDAASAIPPAAMDGAGIRLAARFDRRLWGGIGEVRLLLVKDAPEHGNSILFPGRHGNLRMSVRLADGRWLNGETHLARVTPGWLRIAILQLAAGIVAVLAAAALARNWIVAPFTALAAAAEQLGCGAPFPSLRERGPGELRTMTRAFNLMQARLRAFVDDRTRMLAAISHDLRTPIASLWLRAEMVEDDDLRDAMVRTLADMRAMVDATLAFAREDRAIPSREAFDLAAMVRSVAEEQRALGRDVLCPGPPDQAFRGSPMVLRRAVTNVVENAIRYGIRARLSLAREAGTLRITVDDDGPGVPEDKIEEVFEPFARLEASRSADTGGIGLGRSIARSAARAHGGDVRLRNRTDGGLRCEIVLPLDR